MIDTRESAEAESPERPVTVLPGRVICRCCKVAERQLLSRMAQCRPRTLRELRDGTGAGNGCNACHRVLEGYLRQPLPEPTPASGCHPNLAH